MHWIVVSLGDALGFAQHLREKAIPYGAEKTAAELDSMFAGLTGHSADDIHRLRNALDAIEEDVRAHFPADDSEELAAVRREVDRIVERMDHVRR
ncbi:MAG: hypothetical protein ACM3ZA_11810 [Bacillota bacterium]